jgi:hypothetical protein
VTRLRPDSPAGRVLAELSRHDDGATVEQLAAALYPPPVHPEPVRGEAYAAKLARVSAWREAVQTHRARAAAEVSRHLARLTRSGLVSGRGAPRVPSWAVRAVETGRFSRRSDPWAALVEDYTGSEAPGVARLLRRIVETSPGSRAALGLTTRGEALYDRAVRAGLLLPPTVREVTAEGRAVVTAWGRA